MTPLLDGYRALMTTVAVVYHSLAQADLDALDHLVDRCVGISRKLTD